jgi:hypothetical protein
VVQVQTYNSAELQLSNNDFTDATTTGPQQELTTPTDSRLWAAQGAAKTYNYF